MALQRHFHLYSDGDPPWQWHGVEYAPTPEVYTAVEINQSGDFNIYSLKKDGSVVVNWDLEIVVTIRAEYGKTREQRESDIVSLLGKKLNYVPFEHEESPLAPIYEAFIESIGQIKYVNTLLEVAYIPLKIKRGKLVP